jgi:hypothetical protein
MDVAANRHQGSDGGTVRPRLTGGRVEVAVNGATFDRYQSSGGGTWRRQLKVEGLRWW